MSKVERRFVKTTDNKQMLVWVIYPPDFNPAKKYPTLLVCQGGPQSALTQSYSFRWNYQLMAAQGYVVVAPNRRGMPGHGVAWNEEISKDHGGQAIKDLLSAIDDVAKEPYVDKNKLAAVGASYGGYSVFQLAGVHNNRFKTFIAHDGIFNTESMYGTTEELFFVNWDYGGAYWEKSNKVAMKAYNEFNPSKLVDKWNTPILIIQGGKDFRVPDGQAFEAFQAAQLRGIKSKLLYFPEENHWILTAQNAQVWQREFYKWLDDTLK
jgi:dipeptidyl aminopeptidase/acylaminoacyl peptidase